MFLKNLIKNIFLGKINTNHKSVDKYWDIYWSGPGKGPQKQQNLQKWQTLLSYKNKEKLH